MNHIILKFILLFSSLISINAALAIPLSSIINSDIQQIEYVEHQQLIPSLKLIKTTPQHFLDLLNSQKVSKVSFFENNLQSNFGLYGESLSLFETISIQQQYQAQTTTFLNIIVRHDLSLRQNLFQAKSPEPAIKKPY